MVLAPVDQHLAVAEALLHAGHHQLGVGPLEGPGHVVGVLPYPLPGGPPAQRHVELEPLGPAGLGVGLDPPVGQSLGDEAGHLAALDDGGPLARVEVEDHVVRGPGQGSPASGVPQGHVQLQRGQVGRPHQ